MHRYFNNDNLINEINYYTNILYFSPCIYTKNIALNQIIARACFLNSLKVPQKGMPLTTDIISQRTFTVEELSKFNGRNGNPAYIAVNGVVYDVTDNAAWAAATHFGLSAGKDLTGEFTSCHRGQQQILSRLNIVGRLV